MNYNGWKNRETWALNLHMTNDENNYRVLQNILKTTHDNYQAEKLLREYIDTITDIYFCEYKIMILDVGSFYQVDYSEVIKKNRD